MTTTAKDLIILVHRHKGISFFCVSPMKLHAQFCFRDPEGLIDLAVYDSVYSVRALCFARPDHEKVIPLDVTTSRERTLYSSTRPGEMIENMCFHEDGNQRLKLDRELQPLDEIFVWHKAAITNRYNVCDSGFSQMYLADDMSEAIITDNRRHLLYQRPLRGLTYQQMKDAFQNSLVGVHQNTY